MKPSPRRLPSYDQLMAAAREVQLTALRQEERVALAGGLAMQVWGSDRLTGDLDVVASDPLGYRGEPLTFGGVRFSVEGVSTDVIVRSDEYQDLYEEALDKAVDVDGVPMLVVAPEYLVAMKMVAGRAKDEGDVRYLVTRFNFDQARADDVVRRHLGKFAVRELRSLVDEAKWRASRGES